MPSAQFENYRGKQIYFIDLRNAQPEEALRVITSAQAAVTACPMNSVLTMTDVSGAHYNEKVSDALKALAATNRPHVRAAAVLGVTGVKKIIFSAVLLFSKREMSLFDSRDDARRWLAQH